MPKQEAMLVDPFRPIKVASDLVCLCPCCCFRVLFNVFYPSSSVLRWIGVSVRWGIGNKRFGMFAFLFCVSDVRVLPVWVSVVSSLVRSL